MASNLRTWRRPWDRQPQGVVDLAEAYRGPLPFVLVHNGPHLSGRETSVSGAKVGAFQFGLGYGFGSTFGTGSSDLVQLGSLTPSIHRTFIFQAILAGGGSSGSGRIVDGSETIFFSGSVLKLNRFFSGSPSVGQWSISLSSSSTAVRTVVISHDGSSAANVPKFWVNGAAQSVTTEQTPAGTLNQVAATLNVGNRAALDRTTNGVIGPIFALDRLLPDALAANVSSGDVWQLLEPRRIWVPVSAGGGGTTISVPAGSLALTGFAPIVSATANQTIAVPAGALTLAGFAPTVNVGANQTISVPAGSLTITGFAPTVNVGVNQNIAVPAGSLTLTGFAPTISTSANQTIAVPVGSLTLTGFAPTVVQTAHQTINVPLGTLVMAGYAPTVSASGSYTISVPLGALVLTGHAPVVNNSGASATVTVKLGSWIRYKILT